jgi:hypothetical protein
MHTAASFKAIGPQMGYHYTVVSRLVRKHTQTNNVKDLSKCSMSLNSNHVVLNTMPNVIVDVGLPTVDV